MDFKKSTNDHGKNKLLVQCTNFKTVFKTHKVKCRMSKSNKIWQ